MVLIREAGIYLFSQAVSSQVSSAQVSLTSVFGMGTGGTSPSLTPAIHMALVMLLFLFRITLSCYPVKGCTLKTEYRTAFANRVSDQDGVKPSTY